jgi:hypothetical protein
MSIAVDAPPVDRVHARGDTIPGKMLFHSGAPSPPKFRAE